MTSTSYHNHTTWSDGLATVQEMIESARGAGLVELGISDHYALAPGNPHIPWALPLESLGAYVTQIQESSATAKDIVVRLGLEVDYFPETIELTKSRLAGHSFDYLIGSVHFVNDFPIDLDAEPWERLSQSSRDSVWRGYWQLLRAAAQSGAFDIVGHFDLPKKFKFGPSVDLTEEALAVLDAVASSDMAIEINTSGWDKPVREAYPSLFYLQESKRREIPIVISSDGHSTGQVARHFDRARKLALQAGYTEQVRFERRQRFSHPL